MAAYSLESFNGKAKASEAGRRQPIRVSIAGLGAVGYELVTRLGCEGVPGVELVGIAVRDRKKAQLTFEKLKLDRPPPFYELSELGHTSDVVVECLPATAFEAAVRPALELGKKVVILSVGALLNHPELIEIAIKNDGEIIVPSGALLGLDAVSAAAEGKIESVTMTTRKPIAGLLGAPFLKERGIEIADLREPLLIFKGTAREAAKGFPANLNVAVALSLSGLGPDQTILEIWADPTVVRNTHRIKVKSDSAYLDMTIENIPSDNPKTGRITALSVIALLRKMASNIKIGN